MSTLPSIHNNESYGDMFAIAEAAELLEQRQAELEQRAQARHARRGFERCQALRFAGAKLEQWFDGSMSEKDTIETELSATIDAIQPDGSSQRSALKFKLAHREIRRFKSYLANELGFQEYAVRAKAARRLANQNLNPA